MSAVESDHVCIGAKGEGVVHFCKDSPKANIKLEVAAIPITARTVFLGPAAGLPHHPPAGLQTYLGCGKCHQARRLIPPTAALAPI